MRIALLCPTRKRRNEVNRLIGSLERTANMDNIMLYLGIDSDDNTYNNINKRPWITELDMGDGENFIGIGQLWNKIMKSVPDEILGMCNDDYTYETKGWDEEVLKEFSVLPDDKMKFVYFNDLYAAPQLGVVNFIHREYYDKLGYYAREDYRHAFQDTWLHDVYRRMGRDKYREDIIAPHLHYSNPVAGKGVDSTSQRLLETWGKGEWQKAMDDFNDWGPKRQAEADFLLGKTV